MQLKMAIQLVLQKITIMQIRERNESMMPMVIQKTNQTKRLKLVSSCGVNLDNLLLLCLSFKLVHLNLCTCYSFILLFFE